MILFFKNYIRGKNFIIFFIIVTLCLSFLLSIVNIFFYTNHIINDKTNIINNRELIISTTEDLKTINNKLKHISFIDEVYKNFSPIVGSLYHDGKIDIQLNCAVESHMPKIYLGNNILNKNNNEVVFPSKLKIGDKYISTEDMLNKNVAIEIYNDEKIEKYTFFVIGIYQTENYINNIIYTSSEEMNSLSLEETMTSYIIVINDYKNVKKVIADLQKMNYNASIADYTTQKELNLLLNIKKIISLIIICIISIILILFNTIVVNILSDDVKDIAVLKSIGYTNLIISRISLIKIVSFTTVSFMISIFISMIGIMFLNRAFMNKIIETAIVISIEHILLSYLVVILICYISNKVLMNKIKKISPILIFNLE